MQLFIDESGGLEGKDRLFVVSGVCGDADAFAKRVTKHRRRIGRGRRPLTELKGADLARIAEYEVLSDLPIETRFATVFVRLSDPRHAWAAKELGEPELYARMIEQVRRMVSLGGVDIQGLTIDHGRFKRSVQRRLQDRLERASNRPIPIAFRRSETSPGVQLADLSANLAFRRLNGTPDFGAAPLEGLFRVLDKRYGGGATALDLSEVAPDWLTGEKENGSP
ncbi:MAG: DUF3800 domain-containing protein [Marivibrio sp.]|uniref:DUF3800 domain-containing protein n=1 Tax=Marivibrio sp. TaxID=2039719 RepID=UPI0032F0448A